MHERVYSCETNQAVAYPLGGIGAGMFCLEGNGAYSQFSLFHRPDLLNEPGMYAALSFPEGGTRRAVVLEGPVPERKVFSRPGGGGGFGGKPYGLPRFRDCSFSAKFPFGTALLDDDDLPVSCRITGWSPFVPCDEDASCLPMASVEYALRNKTDSDIKAVFSFHCPAFLRPNRESEGRCRVAESQSGFSLEWQPTQAQSHARGWFSVECDQPDAAVNAAWMRGHGFHQTVVNWKAVAQGEMSRRAAYAETDERQSPGGSLFCAITVPARAEKTVALRFCWYVPESDLREDEPELMRRAEWHDPSAQAYRPWYAEKFFSIEQIARHWRENYAELRARTELFSAALYGTTLDEAVLDAVASNLCILKSPTLLRQADGKMWAWEGSHDAAGSCYGSCTHVWNYAQALAHLFPSLERSFRETEFFIAQEADGYQCFRVPLPIRPATRRTHAAADGQLGGIVKLWREYRISGDKAWLVHLWPQARQSLEYCISTWDVHADGRLMQPHHTTYDVTLWGPDALAQSAYVAALAAAVRITDELGADASRYESLYQKARAYMEEELFDTDYFRQRVMYEELHADYGEYDNSFLGADTPEMQELIAREGPPYQYGEGCLSDGVIGGYFAYCAGLGVVMDADKTASHLNSVVKHNFRENLSRHSNAMRPGYALGDEAALLICTWPRGGRPTLPLLYSDEVFTGIEYQVAAHLAAIGEREASLKLVKAVRGRYNGAIRNPFNEYECGNFYARALASYALLQAHSGVRYDAHTKTLYIAPPMKGDFAVFLCCEKGFGLAGVRAAKPFYQPYFGDLPIETIEYIA